MIATRRSEPSRTDVSRMWVVGLWGMLSVLGAFASYANAADGHRPVTVVRALWLGLATWFVWAPLTFLIARLGQRWPLDQRTQWRVVVARGAAHLAAAIAIGFVATAITAIAVYD